MREVWHRFAARRRNLLGLGLALLLALLAVFADFLASDRPIVLWRAGTLYLIPNLVDYRSLRGFTARDLSRRFRDRSHSRRAPGTRWAPTTPAATRSRA